MLPGVAGLAITQINVFMGTLLASLLAEGSVAAIGYAFRLVQYPIGVVGCPSRLAPCRSCPRPWRAMRSET